MDAASQPTAALSPGEITSVWPRLPLCNKHFGEGDCSVAVVPCEPISHLMRTVAMNRWSVTWIYV